MGAGLCFVFTVHHSMYWGLSKGLFIHAAALSDCILVQRGRQFFHVCRMVPDACVDIPGPVTNGAWVMARHAYQGKLVPLTANMQQVSEDTLGPQSFKSPACHAHLDERLELMV